jgi:hypothetical protein
MKVMAKYLETTFKAYFETMELCVKGRAYWALLHVLVVLPDVCAAMEREGGDTNPDAYREWCTRFLCVSDPVMTPQDWYRLRCMLLHQGRTRDEKGQSQYEHFRFGHPPGDTPSTLHRRIETVKDGRLIHLDVLELSKEVRRAMQKWFEWIGTGASDDIGRNIQKNAEALAQKSVIQEFVPSATSSHEATVTYSVTSSHRPTR